ncbi:MAG TPA: radical SAM protein [Eubacteriaceae bacterium]|jgi:histone acetyltransferase (RNA polymerase elongator complex component)|nr:radical SAM protein [Eubacteriaceae bacterium]
MKNKIIPVFIPHEGCPHDCSFCNQKKISGSVKSPSEDEIQNQIEKYISTNRGDSNFTLAYYGGSFTAIEYDLQIKLLRLAKENLDMGKIQNIRVSTRPDYLGEKNVKLLKEYSVGHVEIGIQSTDPYVLTLAKRFYGLGAVKDAVENLSNEKIAYGFQIMVGLPGDDKKRLLKTTFDLLGLGASTLRIYPCLVIKDTELEKSFYIGNYKPLDIEEAIELVKIPYIVFTSKNVPIIRTGLHSSESLGENGNIVAGPNHPAFGEMVTSSVIYDMICNLLDQRKPSTDLISIKCPSKMRSKVSGNKNLSILKLQERYNAKINLSSDENQKEILIEYLSSSHKLDIKDYILDRAKKYESDYNISR